MHINQMSLTTDIVSRTVKTQKLFNFQSGKCIYVNIQTSKRNQKNQHQPVIKIVNTICRETGAHLSKLTQIRFKEKLILIEDQYAFKCPIENGELSLDKNSSHPTKSSDGSNHSNPLHEETHKSLIPMNKKKLIFKKKYLEDNARMQKRNTKNIAKNFCKAFINYLEQKKNNTLFLRAKQLMSSYNYNNKTIEVLGRDPQTKQQFKQFLMHRASEWVSSSKIFDKKIHHEAIPLYLSLIQAQKGFNYNEQIQHVNGNGSEMNSMVNEEESKNNSVYESDELFEDSPYNHNNNNNQPI